MRADLWPEVTVIVVQPPVLQRVAHNTLDVKTGFAKRHGLLPFVDLQRQ